MELSLRTNLANALNQAFHLDEDSSLLIEGSVVIAPAVRRTPGGTLSAARLNTAALLKGNLARLTGSLARNRKAVALGREALALTDPATQEYVIYSTNVAAWLSDRFEWTGERSDLDEAIAVLAAAQEVVTEGSPLQGACCSPSGVHHAQRYERFTSGEGWTTCRRPATCGTSASPPTSRSSACSPGSASATLRSTLVNGSSARRRWPSRSTPRGG